MYTSEGIEKALRYGNEKGYTLFPEIRNENIIDEIKEHYDEINILTDYVNDVYDEPSPEITFQLYKQFDNTGNRVNFERAYFKRRKQLFSIILLYIINKEKKYIPIIEKKLWEWCELYSWELPAHFEMTEEAVKKHNKPDETVALFAAESAFFFAEILSIIGKDLDEFLVYRLKNEISRRVIVPYMRGSFWWENAKMNWSSVCAGSVGAAAIYLVEDVQELSLILERVLKSMEAFIEAFDKDGLITEGLSYWSYGFSFYVYFAELLKERTCGRISLLTENEKIKKIAELPQILQFPNGSYVNFSDAGGSRWYGDRGVFSRLEKVLGVKGYNYDNSTYIYDNKDYKWSTMARKLFWRNVLNKHEYEEVKSGSFYFSESQWLVDRRIMKDGSFEVFAAKGGNNNEPHNHNDLGNFILHYDNEDIFVDIGAPEYVKEYFRDETRYEFIAASSVGHSVPVINSNLQGFGSNYYAELLKIEDKDSKEYYKLNLCNAYKCDELVKYDREFIWNYDSMELVIKDNFKFNKSCNEIQEAFITRIKPELAEPGKIIINAKNSKVEFTFNSGLRCVIEELKFNNHEGEKASVYRTLLIGNTDFAVEYIFNMKLINLLY